MIADRLLYVLAPILWIAGYGVTLHWLGWKDGAEGAPRPPWWEMLFAGVVGFITWPIGLTWLLYDQHRKHQQHR